MAPRTENRIPKRQISSTLLLTGQDSGTSAQSMERSRNVTRKGVDTNVDKPYRGKGF